MDEELRIAIDRLVKVGGRLTVHAADPDTTSVVLEQPGAKFGILEVRGRATLDGVEADAVASLQSIGWSDPNVTSRLGREIRLRPEDGPGLPAVLTRTWRVPPALASEIERDVLAAVPDPGRMELQSLPSRDARPTAPSVAPRPPTEELEIEAPAVPSPRLARSLPAPLRASVVLALAVVVAFVWAGMIRGAPRLASTSAEGPNAVAGATGGALVTAAAPTTAATPIVSLSPAPIRPDVATASTEDPVGKAEAAIDGNPMTAWHAAFGVPQWIEIGLSSPSTLNEVQLLIAQSENGPSRHMIQVVVTGQAPRVVAIINSERNDGEAIYFRPEEPILNVERIRIETMVSPANAGWYEVIVR